LQKRSMRSAVEIPHVEPSCVAGHAAKSR
jgi:hypothetical protein